MRVDYDTLAPAYNRRRALADFAPLAQTLRQVAAQRGAHRILDLGCGTGASLAGVAPEGARKQWSIGLDRSFGMLTQAQRTYADLAWVQGTADALPRIRGSSGSVHCRGLRSPRGEGDLNRRMWIARLSGLGRGPEGR